MAGQYDNRGRDQINIEQVVGNVSIQSQSSPRTRNEQILLQAVQDEVASRLEQSLHNAVLINLRKRLQPEQVKRPWDVEIKIGNKPVQPLPPDTQVLQIFEQSLISGKLLILGEPGSGKTTTLLDLAQALAAKADANATYPIPVLLNLSSWTDPRQPLYDWLVSELKSKYGIKAALSQQWLNGQYLLPLLDGLDEVRPEHQPACIQVINQFLRSDRRPLYVVVCSRHKEYEANSESLELNGAICLQDLSNQQIQDYLNTVSQSDLWQGIKNDADLLDLVRKPLVLSITMLSYGEIELTQWHQATTTSAKLDHLLDAYVRCMLTRQIHSRAYHNSESPNPKLTCYWLTTLAQQLQRDSQTEFLIEKMQSNCLQPYQKLQYRIIIVIIFSIILGLIFWLTGKIIIRLLIDFYISNLNFENQIPGVSKIIKPGAFKDGVDSALQKGVFGGSIAMITLGAFLGARLGSSKIEFKSSFNIKKVSWIKFRNWLMLGSITGTAFSLVISGVTALITRFYSPQMFFLSRAESGEFSRTPIVTEPIWFYFGSFLFVLWIGIWFSFVVVKGLQSDIQVVNYPSQFIGLSVKQTIIFSLIYFSGLMLPTFFVLEQLYRQGLGFSQVLLINFAVGILISITVFGIESLQHFVLRFVLFLSGSIPWNYARFLNYATERLLLQRIGGRYRFTHKHLQEHFANMERE